MLMYCCDYDNKQVTTDYRLCTLNTYFKYYSK